MRILLNKIFPKYFWNSKERSVFFLCNKGYLEQTLYYLQPTNTMYNSIKLNTSCQHKPESVLHKIDVDSCIEKRR